MRKGPIVPGPTVPNPRQLHEQQARELQRREQAKSQAKRPTEKDLPDGLDDVVIGDGVERYKKLRVVERKIDSIMMRKRMDIADSQARNHVRKRKLRVWISNTVKNQPWQQTSMEPESFDFGTDSQASFRVKIEGRLLDDNEDDILDDDDEPKAAEKDDAEKEADAMETDAKTKESSSAAPADRTRFSHFFKQINIDFDRSASLQPDGFSQIEWKKPAGTNRGTSIVQSTSDQANFDCLEFERKSDENINITIKLYRDEQPERYRLSEDLARLLDTEEDYKANIIMGLWNYILEMGLQQDEDVRTVRLDENLKKVRKWRSKSEDCLTIFQIFGRQQDVVMFNNIPQFVVENHLQPLPPITLKYTIRVDKAYIEPSEVSPSSSTAEATELAPSAPTVYDIIVPSSDPYRNALGDAVHFHNFANHKDHPAQVPLKRLVALDDSLALAVQAITRSRAKHAFLGSLSKDPSGFINRWVSSQRRDLQVILGESRGGVAGVGSIGMGWEENGREEWRWGGKDGVWGSKAAVEAAGLYLGKMRPAAQI